MVMVYEHKDSTDVQEKMNDLIRNDWLVRHECQMNQQIYDKVYDDVIQSRRDGSYLDLGRYSVYEIYMALVHACAFGNTCVVEKVIEYNNELLSHPCARVAIGEFSEEAEIDGVMYGTAHYISCFGYTPLQISIVHNKWGVMKLILANDNNAKDLALYQNVFDKNSLHTALLMERPKLLTIKYLLDHAPELAGIKMIKAVYKEGCKYTTPIHKAYEDITPLEIAKRVQYLADRQEVIKLIEDTLQKTKSK